MRKFHLYICSMAILGMLWLAVPGPAFSRDGPRYTLDQAVMLVRKVFGGQVLKATASEHDGRLVYRIRILTEDGRVRTFTVDARDGLVR